MSEFGFWGGEIDYNRYYGELKGEEVSGKDEEFIEGMLRLLCGSIVCKKWKGRDFSEKGVLKGCMRMVLGERVKCEDESNIGNGIGGV